MEAEFGSISVGSLVDIQRSNGKIHSARVTGVNVGTRVVTVEWFEGGDTKGKEVTNYNCQDNITSM